MTAESREARAIRSLSEQVEQLKALRNARTRDIEFKQWRQSTLTIVQRIWPGDAKRSARFRRVPFSPPSSRADGRELREAYERGCAEAVQLLLSFVEDIERDGIPSEAAAARPASLDPGVAEDDFPTVELPGGPEPPAERAAAVPAPPPKAAEAPRKKRRRNGARRKLRDMLGLDALQKLGSGDEADPDGQVDAVAQADEAPRTEQPRTQDAKAEAPGETEAEAPETHTQEEVPAGADTPPADDKEADATDDDDAAGSRAATDDFLSASPVFRSSARPVQRLSHEARASAPPPDSSSGPRGLTAPTAMAIAAVAAEVARLGVPDRRRADVRGTLVALAETLEEGALDWNALRRAVEFSMEFPAIARRVIPLLIPFLDEAA